MKKYVVEIGRYCSEFVTVQAESVEEARDNAESEAKSGLCIHCSAVQLMDIERADVVSVDGEDYKGDGDDE